MGDTSGQHGRKGAAKVKHLGRTEARTRRRLEKYYGQVWAPRKIRHMLKNNGWQFAMSWAQRNNCEYLMPSKG